MANLIGILVLMTLLLVSLSQAQNEGGKVNGIDGKINALSRMLDGDIYVAGEEYDKGMVRYNPRFDSNFSAVAMVKSTSDVSKVLKFCKENNIRPTVRSSGHDFIGRSSGKGTMSINLGLMKEMTINRNDPLNNYGPTITAQPGANWFDIYTKTYNEKAGLIALGGNAHTVAPGGFITGGGHSPLSPRIGLGVDSTLQFTIVTANGDIITTTRQSGTIQYGGIGPKQSFSDSEFYWAVLGGGGGTFGVITEYVFKLHQAPSNGLTGVLVEFPVIKHEPTGDIPVGRMVLEKWDSILLRLDQNWSGYVLFRSPKTANYTGKIVMLLLHWNEQSYGLDIINELKNLYPQYSMYPLFTYNVSDFYDFAKGQVDPWTGYRTYTANRLIQEADLLPSSKMPELLAGISKVSNEYDQVKCTWTLVGGKNGAAYKNPNGYQNSVSPKLRSTYGAFSCGVGWADCDTDNKTIDWFKSWTDTLYNIGDGVYFNEPEYELADWKVEYWGDMVNYDRLLKMKQKYDPDNMFWCHHCVGSDLVQGFSPGPEPCSSAFVKPFSMLLLVMFLIINIW